MRSRERIDRVPVLQITVNLIYIYAVYTLSWSIRSSFSICLWYIGTVCCPQLAPLSVPGSINVRLRSGCRWWLWFLYGSWGQVHCRSCPLTPVCLSFPCSISIFQKARGRAAGDKMNWPKGPLVLTITSAVASRMSNAIDYTDSC